MDFVSYNSGSDHAPNFKLAAHYTLIDFDIIFPIPSWILLHSAQLLINHIYNKFRN